MKRFCVLLFLLLLILSGCKDREEQMQVQPPIDDSEKQLKTVEEKIEEKPAGKLFEVDPASFHFTAGWLTDTEIVFVEKKDGLYEVKSFDIETGESRLLHQDQSFITEVYIHPSGDYLLLHTSEQPDSAVIKMIGIDGIVQHQIEIESTELSVEWNRTDPEKILFTAFHEDWSFDLFVFDAHSESLSLVDLEDPFPKWLGDDQIASMRFQDHPLDGGSIQLLNPIDGKSKSLGIEDVLYFASFADSLFIVQAGEEDALHYTIRDLAGAILEEWEMPAVSNYSEWVIPEVEWADGGSVIFKGPIKGGQLDEIASSFNLLVWKGGKPEMVAEGFGAEPFNCSPSGKRCLSGYTYETMIDMDTGGKNEWIRAGK